VLNALGKLKKDTLQRLLNTVVNFAKVTALFGLKYSASL